MRAHPHHLHHHKHRSDLSFHPNQQNHPNHRATSDFGVLVLRLGLKLVIWRGWQTHACKCRFFLGGQSPELVHLLLVQASDLQYRQTKCDRQHSVTGVNTCSLSPKSSNSTSLTVTPTRDGVTGKQHLAQRTCHDEGEQDAKVRLVVLEDEGLSQLGGWLVPLLRGLQHALFHGWCRWRCAEEPPGERADPLSHSIQHEKDT